LPPFSGDETLSSGDAFSAVAPDMDCQIGHPGWPALSSSALDRRNLRPSGQGESIAAARASAVSRLRIEARADSTRPGPVCLSYARLALGSETEYRPQMGGEVEVERHPHIGNEPRGLRILADPTLPPNEK
jgi:hypothetical protein